jgi:peptidoglycan/xylan/chitin deacetylase (PgdA/CDA1 family)
MRFDRFLTLHVFRHLSRIFPRPKGIRIPILMYHSISDEPEKGHPYFWINTSPKRFAEHMKFLHDNNYKVIDLSEAVSIISSQKVDLNSQFSHISPSRHSNGESTHSSNIPLFQHSSVSVPTFHPSNIPQKKVVLTFDDGYRDFYTTAFSTLNSYGFPATVFLPTSFINNSKKPGIKGKEHLSWTEVRELQKIGTRFGSHTVNHRQLIDLDEPTIRLELKESKERIEDETGAEVEDFSYPYRFPDQAKSFVKKLENLLGEYKYKQGISTRIGTFHSIRERFLLKRIPANSTDDLAFFKAKIEGGYNWIYKVQYFLKKSKESVSMVCI